MSGSEAWAAATREAGRCAVPGCTATWEKWRRADDRLEGHHVLARMRIRQYARTMRLDKSETEALLWDTANHLALCGRHHNRHERALERVPRYVVPEAAWQFAAKVGLAHVLERAYPDVGA